MNTVLGDSNVISGLCSTLKNHLQVSLDRFCFSEFYIIVSGKQKILFLHTYSFNFSSADGLWRMWTQMQAEEARGRQVE